MDVYKEEAQIICGQELRLRGDAADGAVAAAKAGWLEGGHGAGH